MARAPICRRHSPIGRASLLLGGEICYTTPWNYYYYATISLYYHYHHYDYYYH